MKNFNWKLFFVFGACLITTFFVWFFIKPYDSIITLNLDQYNYEFLFLVTKFLTEYFLYAVLAGITFFMLFYVWKNKKYYLSLVPIFFSGFIAAVLGYGLKSVFRIPRPYLSLAVEPKLLAPSWSFPSNHTFISFALLIPFYRLSKPLGISWAVFAVAIGVSRVYQNVHYVSDVLAGLIWGISLGWLLSHRSVLKLIFRWWKNKEFRRQTFHFSIGFFFVFFHWAGYLRWRFLIFILAFGLIISLLMRFAETHWYPFIRKKFSLKIAQFLIGHLAEIKSILENFDRVRDKKFPGRGGFCFLIGIILLVLFFPQKIIYASILILSIGDSINHFYVKKIFWGRLLPWNKRKTILGIILGIIFSTLVAQFFVPFWPALFASSLSLFAETFPFKIGKYYIDDNIFIPIMAACILSLLI